MDDDDSKVWSLYDAGPKSIRCPIIFLPPVSGTAEVFFQQLLALSGWGYRVISVCSDSFFYYFTFSHILPACIFQVCQDACCSFQIKEFEVMHYKAYLIYKQLKH